jgi:hypothetical protein
MSKISDRLKGPSGEASSKANLKYWSDCAEKNSYDAPGNGPLTKGDSEGRREALANKNHSGDSTFMRGIRRGA